MPDSTINNTETHNDPSPNLPLNVDALLLKANAAMNRENYAEAEALCQKILEHNSDDKNALKLLSLTLWKKGQLNSAVLQASYLLELYPEDADAYYIMGAVLHDLGRLDPAAAALREAMRLNPDLHAALESYAAVLQTQGQQASALEIYEALLAFDASQGQRWLNYSSSRVFPKGDMQVKQLQKQLKQNTISKRQRAQMQFALAKMYQNAGNYTQAFRAYQAGNRLRAEEEQEPLRQLLSGQTLQQAQHLIDQFTPEWFADRADWVQPLRDTTLILGPAGSGKVVLEGALNAHPQIQSYGELNIIEETLTQFDRSLLEDYPESLTGLEQEDMLLLSEMLDAAWGDPPQAETATHLLTNPEHVFHVGTLVALNPNTRLVVCERDALDTSMVIYMRWLNKRQPYAWSLRTIAEYLCIYHRLIRHWQSLWPERVWVLRYADLLSQPDECMAKVLAWHGVDWDERCADAQAEVVDPEQVGFAGSSRYRSRVNPEFTRISEVYRDYVPLFQRALEEAEVRVNEALP